MRKSLRKKRQYGTLKRDLQQTQKLQHDARGPWQSRNQEWRQWFLSSILINNNWRLSLSTTLWLTSILGSSQLFWGALFWSFQMQVWFISLFFGLCSVCVLSLDSELNRLRKIHRSPPSPPPQLRGFIKPLSTSVSPPRNMYVVCFCCFCDHNKNKKNVFNTKSVSP